MEGPSPASAKAERHSERNSISTRICCRMPSISANAFPLVAPPIRPGTIRFGRDPKTSALDVNCKAHDLDNLYVVDAGFFVSIGAVNPSLTIIANALRVGDHLISTAALMPPRNGDWPWR